MIVRLVKSYKAFLALESDWDALWKSACPDNVFLHFRWIRSFIDAFDLENRLYILIWQTDSRIAAILPLLRDENGLLRFIGAPRADYSDLLCSRDDIEQAVAGIFGFLFSRSDWRRLEIPELSERSALYRYCHENGNLQGKGNWRRSSKCPGIEFSPDGATLNTLVRKRSLRRRENGLARHGEVTFRELKRWEDARPLLDVFFSQHIARWKSAGQESQFLAEAERRFCEYYVRDLLGAGLLHFTVLSCGEDIMAIHIGFATENSYIWYKPTYNIDFSRLSPGEVLIKRLLEHCDGSGIRYFDFARGAEKFKKRFSNALYHNHDLVVFARARDQFLYRLRQKISDAAEKIARRVARLNQRPQRAPT